MPKFIHILIRNNLYIHNTHFNRINHRFIDPRCSDYKRVNILSTFYHRHNKIHIGICKSYDYILKFFQRWIYSYHIVWNEDYFVKNRFPVDHKLPHDCPSNIWDRIIFYKLHRKQVDFPLIWWSLRNLLSDKVSVKDHLRSCKNCGFWRIFFLFTQQDSDRILFTDSWFYCIVRLDRWLPQTFVFCM